MSRANLSSDLRDQIRDRIVAGEMAPASRINEVRLSKELEVSRTPLREALFGLVNEEFVREVPRRGFFVTELSVPEIRQLYVIRQILDPAALRLAGVPSGDTLDQLEQLNTEIVKAKKTKRVIELDDQWHLQLIAGCRNQILLDLITQHMARTRRYEFAYLGQEQNVSVATEEHDAILSALREGKLALACKRLEQNMTSAEGPLIEWVKSQQSNP